MLVAVGVPIALCVFLLGWVLIVVGVDGGD